MSQIAIMGVNGHATAVDEAALHHFERDLHGAMLTRQSPDYQGARKIWNAMIDHYPTLIVQCKETSDVQATVKLAAKHGLLISVRSGGHHIAGNSCCHGGVMIDLSGMTMVKLDSQTHTAMVNPGCTLGEFDAASTAQEMVVPLGINSTTGIAGLTLGGGFGWISRKHGLTIDSLASARLVTADGELVTANAGSNPDLYWAIRGGGGNFGIVVSFTFRMKAIESDVLSGFIAHPFDDAPQALRFYREFCATLPDEISVWAVLRRAPPLPFLPAEWHGKLILIFAVCALGDHSQAQAALKPLREYGKPIADVIGPTPYATWQRIFDPLLTPGARNYWKSHNFHELSDGAIDAMIEGAKHFPSAHSEIIIAQLGGAVSRIPQEETAYPDRAAKFIMNVHGRWGTMEEDRPGITWARSVFDAVTPFASGGRYVNFMTGDELDRVSGAYGPGYQRLQDLKRKWDPNNMFRLNQNIKPTA